MQHPQMLIELCDCDVSHVTFTFVTDMFLTFYDGLKWRREFHD